MTTHWSTSTCKTSLCCLLPAVAAALCAIQFLLLCAFRTASTVSVLTAGALAGIFGYERLLLCRVCSHSRGSSWHLRVRKLLAVPCFCSVCVLFVPVRRCFVCVRARAAVCRGGFFFLVSCRIGSHGVCARRSLQSSYFFW